MKSRKEADSRIGEVFEDWTIIGIERSPGKLKYILRCKCGFEKKALGANLKQSRCCPRCLGEYKYKDYVGKTFGKLTVLETAFIDGRRLLKVRCHCKNEYYLPAYRILFNRGCCICKNGFYPGKIIDGLEILEYLGNRKYKIKCVCGKIFEKIPSKNKGKYSTCGCKKNESTLNKAKSKIGMTYGKIKVNKLLGNLEGHYIFEMKCKCGNTFLRKNGHEFKSKSCGCLIAENNPGGELKGNSKLKNFQILSLRELYESKLYTIKEISEMYGLSAGYISRIIKREIWKHI